MIRLNTSIAPTPYASQNRLGLLAGQNDGFPNGRRLIDDVTDIELRALAGGTPFTPDFNHRPEQRVDGRCRQQRQAVPHCVPLRAGAQVGLRLSQVGITR